MANTYYDSQLTAEEIEAALEAVDGIIVPANNGKVLVVEDGLIKAKSVLELTGGAVLESLSVTTNGDYYPGSGVDGFDEVHIAVPGALLGSKSISANGTYQASGDSLDGYSSVVVAVPSSAPNLQSKTVTQNGTVTPDAGYDGLSSVVVNVSGGGSPTAFTRATSVVASSIMTVQVTAKEVSA